MTAPSDPVRAWLDRANAQTQRGDVPALLAAVTAVLDLHRPDECGDCIACGVDTWENSIEFPCDTYNAVSAALGVTE